MINNIKIAGVASYDRPGVEITALQKINFIYGANGCGKTTISNFLANTSDPRFGACSIEWDDGNAINVLAYNKKFRDENFTTGKISGVFTLGKATKDELENIQIKKDELVCLRDENAKQKDTLSKQEAQLQQLMDGFTDECWAFYKQNERDFKEALRGSINSKVVFRDKILSEKKSNASAILSRSDLKDKADTLLAKQPVRLATVPTINTDVAIKDVECDDIWNKVIIGKTDVDISALIGKLGNSDWVNQGRQYLSGDDTCPFCQKKTIDDILRKQIEAYFDEGFEKDSQRIKTQAAKYTVLTAGVISILDQIEALEKSNEDTKLDIDKFSMHLKVLHVQIAENKLLIASKLEKPSREVILVDTDVELIALSGLISAANSTIGIHNQLVDNYSQEVSMLKSEVWRFLVEELSEKIKKYEGMLNGFNKGISNIKQQIHDRGLSISQLNNNIVALSKNVTSVQPAVDEINRLLSAYGFTGFKIVSSPDQKNFYAIRRDNGDLAHDTLSEGEITFITFLYFVQLAKGAIDEDSVTDDRVIVVDDPISSLDSNILYVVSTIIKNIIREIKENHAGSIKQLFLLTHNVYFHKEASFWGGRKTQDKDVHFWILRKSLNITSIQPFGKDNPIESSYELLWREVKEWQRNAGITLQNTLRRIIENYFKILGKYKDENLVEKFSTFEDQQICRSLLSWINDGSHTIPDDLFVQAPEDSAEKYLAVFEKIFEHTGNYGHYQMMMGVEN